MINLKDLIGAQEKLKSAEKIVHGTEHISMEQLKGLSARGIPKHAEPTPAEAAKSVEVQKDTTDALKSIEKNVSKVTDSLVKKTGDGITSNTKKLFDEIKNQTKVIQKLSKDEIKSVTETALERRQQKTIGTKIESMKGSVKDFFTMRGFMDKTGIVKKGTGGMLDNMLQNREEKKQYADVRKKVEKAADPSLVQNKKYMKGLTDDWKKIQKVQNDIRKNEEAIGKMKQAGFSEEQLANTKELTFREELAKKLSSIDTRVTPEKENPKGKPKTANDKADAVDAEARDEQIAATEEQSKLLKQIAENTGEGKAGKVKPEKKEEKDEGGGLFGGLIKNWKSSLIKGFKAMFNPKNLMKLLTKVALPILIVTSIVKGLMAGFDEFKKSGSIKEAIISGLGAILEFISFGLFDKESIRGIVNAVAGFYTEYIEKPVKAFIGAITSVFTTVSDFFKSAIESFTGLLKSIGIPEFKFKIPVVGTEVSLGPYYPFADGGATPAPASTPPTAVKPTSAAEVSGKSAANAGAAQSGGSSNVVVAPTTNVSNTKNEATVYRHTTRNPESTFNRHIDSRYSPA
jgi:hypothetical protein